MHAYKWPPINTSLNDNTYHLTRGFQELAVLRDVDGAWAEWEALFSAWDERLAACTANGSTPWYDGEHPRSLQKCQPAPLTALLLPQPGRVLPLVDPVTHARFTSADRDRHLRAAEDISVTKVCMLQFCLIFITNITNI